MSYALRRVDGVLRLERGSARCVASTPPRRLGARPPLLGWAAGWSETASGEPTGGPAQRALQRLRGTAGLPAGRCDLGHAAVLDGACLASHSAPVARRITWRGPQSKHALQPTSMATASSRPTGGRP